MIRILALSLLILTAACREETMELPTGLEVELLETLVEAQPHEDETWIIVRVLAPSLAGQQVTPEDMATETDAICARWGVPAATQAPELPAQIVVQIMSEPVERGLPARGITQVFAGYRFENGLCIWEDF